MRIDDEPAFNTAEDAYQAQKYDVATDGYFKTLKSSAKEWLKQYVAPRLVDSAQKANRFDAAAFAYTTMLVHDPTTAKEIKLAIPQQNSTYLTSAIVDAKTAMADTKLTPEQKLAVGNFLLELEKAKRDPMAGSALNEAKTAAGESPAAAAASSALAKQRLDAAALALQQKDYTKAVAEINAARAAYRTPADQAQALYTLAEAQAGIAAISAGGNDENASKDTAIAYLRVVA